MNDDQIIEELILAGALEASAVSETGELLYSFTNKLKDIGYLNRKKNIICKNLLHQDVL